MSEDDINELWSTASGTFRVVQTDEGRKFYAMIEMDSLYEFVKILIEKYDT